MAFVGVRTGEIEVLGSLKTPKSRLLTRYTALKTLFCPVWTALAPTKQPPLPVQLSPRIEQARATYASAVDCTTSCINFLLRPATAGSLPHTGHQVRDTRRIWR